MAVQNTSGEGDVNVVQFRIERGAEAMATDGRIGIVEQIVVDRTSGQLLSLVIRGEETNTEFEMPATHVLRATGDHVYLDVSRTDLMNNPSITTPYDPAQYVPVYQGDAMPPDVASRVASEEEKPVVTDVEENAAELIAPEMTTARTDERVASTPTQPATTAGPATDKTTWIPDAGVPSSTDATPTVKLKRADGADREPADWGEAVGTEGRPVPTPEASATPETTGPLMGGKPSTGGMGTASSVPTSTDPALDTVATSPDLPPYTTEHPPIAPVPQPPTPNLAPADVIAPMPLPVPPSEAALAPNIPTGIPMEEPEEEPLLPSPSPQRMTEPRRQPANLRDHLPDLLLNMARSPEVWILAGSLGVGVIGGILVRRRNTSLNAAPRVRKAKGAAGNALNKAQDRLQEAQSRLADSTGETLQSAKRTTAQTRRQVKKSARRVARRGRWFRRGLLLGSAGALLLAPQRGEQTRTQLKARLDRWRA